MGEESQCSLWRWGGWHWQSRSGFAWRDSFMVPKCHSMLPQVWNGRTTTHHFRLVSDERGGLCDRFSVQLGGRLQKVFGLSLCQGWWLCHGPQFRIAGVAYPEESSDHYETCGFIQGVGTHWWSHRFSHCDSQIHNACFCHSHCWSLRPCLHRSRRPSDSVGSFGSLEADPWREGQWHDLFPSGSGIWGSFMVFPFFSLLLLIFPQLCLSPNSTFQ